MPITFDVIKKTFNVSNHTIRKQIKELEKDRDKLISKLNSKDENEVVKKIFMFNAYDYDSFFGEGIQRGNFFAKFILFHVSIPVIGILFCSLENKFILKRC